MEYLKVLVVMMKTGSSVGGTLSPVCVNYAVNFPMVKRGVWLETPIVYTTTKAIVRHV
jgi:hypothetical protein